MLTPMWVVAFIATRDRRRRPCCVLFRSSCHDILLVKLLFLNQILILLVLFISFVFCHVSINTKRSHTLLSHAHSCILRPPPPLQYWYEPPASSSGRTHVSIPRVRRPHHSHASADHCLFYPPHPVLLRTSVTQYGLVLYSVGSIVGVWESALCMILNLDPKRNLESRGPCYVDPAAAGP